MLVLPGLWSFLHGYNKSFSNRQSMKKTAFDYIEKTLRECLMQHIPPLIARVNTTELLEMSGTKPGMQGRQQVDGYYFASIVPKPKDVRLYFFPIYTHKDKFNLSPEFKKKLKGKSCFHINELTPALEIELKKMIATGVSLYKEEDLI